MQILHVKHEHSKHAYAFKEKKGWWDKLLQQVQDKHLDDDDIENTLARLVKEPRMFSDF